jgi:hypothetical protein
MGPHGSLMLQTSRPEIDEETSLASASFQVIDNLGCLCVPELAQGL